MPMTEIAVRKALDEVVRALEAQRARLQELAPQLPGEDERRPGRIHQLRGVLECVLADSLGPAIATLRDAARKRPQKRARGPRAPRPLAIAGAAGIAAATGPVRAGARG